MVTARSPNERNAVRSGTRYILNGVQPLKGLNVLNGSVSSYLPARWKRIHSSDDFKNFDNLGVPRQLRDKFLLVFRHEWRWIESKKFFVLFVKLAILVSTAKGLPDYLGEFLRCARGQINSAFRLPKKPAT